MTRAVKFICDNCGSDELIFDTTSSWNASTQSWEHEGEYDHDPCCQSDTCQGDETSYHTIDIDTGKKVKNWRGEWIALSEYKRRLAEQHRAYLQDQKDRDALATAQQNATLLGEAYG